MRQGRGADHLPRVWVQLYTYCPAVLGKHAVGWRLLCRVKGKANPLTFLNRPLGIQEVDAPSFQDSRDMNVVRLPFIPPPRKYSLYSYVYSAPYTHTHTPNLGKSIKLIEIIHHFPYNVIFLLHLVYVYYIVLYYILYYSLQNCIILYFILLYFIIFYIIVLYYILYYCIILYFILFIAELHMRPHLRRFYFNNNNLLNCILSF
jgi:hypothetical protein